MRLWGVIGIWLAVGLLAAGVAGVAMAEDVDVAGKVFRNVRVQQVDPDGITVMHAGGVEKVMFEQLPVEWQERYGYDPQKASFYRDEMAARRQESQGPAAQGPEDKARRRASRQKVLIDVEVVDVRRDGAVVRGTRKVMKVVDREREITAKVLKGPESVGAGSSSGAAPEEKRVVRYRENAVADEPFENALVVGLPSALGKGARWSGTVYPAEGARDGLMVFSTSLDQAVATALGRPDAIPSELPAIPFLAGLGDGLTFPLRMAHFQGLEFTPAKARDFRYWSGAIVGGCAYPIVLLLLFGKRKDRAKDSR